MWVPCDPGHSTRGKLCEVCKHNPRHLGTGNGFGLIACEGKAHKRIVRRTGIDGDVTVEKVSRLIVSDLMAGHRHQRIGKFFDRHIRFDRDRLREVFQ